MLREGRVIGDNSATALALPYGYDLFQLSWPLLANNIIDLMLVCHEDEEAVRGLLYNYRGVLTLDFTAYCWMRHSVQQY